MVFLVCTPTYDRSWRPVGVPEFSLFFLPLTTPGNASSAQARLRQAHLGHAPPSVRAGSARTHKRPANNCNSRARQLCASALRGKFQGRRSELRRRRVAPEPCRKQRRRQVLAQQLHQQCARGETIAHAHVRLCALALALHENPTLRCTRFLHTFPPLRKELQVTTAALTTTPV